MLKRIAFLFLVVTLIGPLAVNAKTTSKNQTKDCDDCPLLAIIPAGAIDIRVPPGVIGRAHNTGWYTRVHFIRPFLIGVFEVTNAQ